MEEVSMDFLDFWPSTIIDLIFQHLSGNEVLSATLVSPNWNEFLSVHSLTCWKNIVVQPKVSDDLSYLENSQRRYEHLKAVNVSSLSPEMVKIVETPGRKWKSMVIFRTVFGEKSQLENILAAAVKTIERLEFFHLSRISTTKNESSQSFNFPRLKSLRIAYHDLDESPPWINNMFTRAPHLQTLQLTNACDENMKKLILSCENLKHLSVSARFQDINFFRDLSMNMPSRLEEFEINDILSSSNDDFNLSHFNNFFKSQSKTLKKFETDALLELNEFETAFKMPGLHTLNIKSFHYNRELIDDYLETLRVSTVPEASLKNFNVRFMNQHLLTLLALNARGLEQLRADEISADNASNPEWFPKLQRVQIFFMDQELENRIRAKAAEDRSRLERLILEGIIPMQIEIDFPEEEDQEIIERVEA